MSSLPTLAVLAWGLLATGGAHAAPIGTEVSAPEVPGTEVPAPEVPDAGLYRLELPLVDDAGQPFKLSALAGHPVVITMFYGECPHVCPALISNVQKLVAAVPEAHRAQVRVALVSFNPADQPAFLRTLRGRHGLGPEVSMAMGAEGTVRTLATALDIRYRKLPDGSFGHTSIITVLDRAGRIVGRQAGGPASTELVATLRQLAAQD